MINMSKSFKEIVSYTYGILELIGRELKRSDNLQAHLSSSIIEALITNLIATVECCKDLPIFSNLNNLGKDEVLSSICIIHDSFDKLADKYCRNIDQIVYEGESVVIIYELMIDIAFETLLYLQTNHEEYFNEWNKL